MPSSDTPIDMSSLVLLTEEYASLYGEYESERRRNMDLTEARDRLADHIKILSDELGDREVGETLTFISGR